MKATIPADVTVCMEAIKVGMLKFPAYTYLGDLEVVSIDLPDMALIEKHASADVIDQGLVEENLPERDLDAHKGTFGTAMIVAGSLNYTGAALLAGRAAYRTGTGLVPYGCTRSFAYGAGRAISGSYLAAFAS